MQARVDIEGDVSIVRLSGYLDFETVIPFKRDCLNTITTSKVIFDFEALNFVGSCGLTSFLQTLLSFGEALERRPRYVRAGTEFRRLMQTIDFLDSDFYESTQLARESFIYSDMGSAAIGNEFRTSEVANSGPLFAGESPPTTEAVERENEPVHSNPDGQKEV